MSAELSRLAERRHQLVAKAAAQRATLAHALALWSPRLALVDHGVAAVREIGRHPAWVAGVVLVVAVWRPRGVARWLQRGWVVWQFSRSLRRS